MGMPPGRIEVITALAAVGGPCKVLFWILLFVEEIPLRLYR
jgi:hypothetical protein